jgi:hypothetical protein
MDKIGCLVNCSIPIILDRMLPIQINQLFDAVSTHRIHLGVADRCFETYSLAKHLVCFKMIKYELFRTWCLVLKQFSHSKHPNIGQRSIQMPNGTHTSHNNQRLPCLSQCLLNWFLLVTDTNTRKLFNLRNAQVLTKNTASRNTNSLSSWLSGHEKINHSGFTFSCFLIRWSSLVNWKLFGNKI